MSAPWYATLTPSAAISALGPSASPKPFNTMLAPCLAKAFAMPRPMPLVDPVTSAVLPCNMLMTPKDELGCSKAHYGAVIALFLTPISEIVSDCHDPKAPTSKFPASTRVG